jgi:hypothetical protein
MENKPKERKRRCMVALPVTKEEFNKFRERATRERRPVSTWLVLAAESALRRKPDLPK